MPEHHTAEKAGSKHTQTTFSLKLGSHWVVIRSRSADRIETSVVSLFEEYNHINLARGNLISAPRTFRCQHGFLHPIRSQGDRRREGAERQGASSSGNTVALVNIRGPLSLARPRLASDAPASTRHRHLVEQPVRGLCLRCGICYLQGLIAHHHRDQCANTSKLRARARAGNQKRLR